VELSLKPETFFYACTARFSAYSGPCILKQIAGWSSPVARQAHNLKVLGSNPSPATILKAGTKVPACFMISVYVIENPQGRRYVGCTTDLPQRLHAHNAGVSTWTRLRGPWSLVWSRECVSLGEARKLENLLKRQGRGAGFYRITGLTKPSS
jgi:predicted GIY-YIG superfamily endonuclease